MLTIIIIIDDLILYTAISVVAAVQLPFLPNVTLAPKSSSSGATLTLSPLTSR